MPDVRIKKDPGIAAVLSFFISGLGQIYNGDMAKGFIIMGIQVINIFLMFLLIGFITFPLVWLFAIWDAYRVAKNSHKDPSTEWKGIQGMIRDR